MKEYKEDLVNRILSNSASLCPYYFQDYTVRGETMSQITWNEVMLRDEGVDISKLRDLTILLENGSTSFLGSK